MKLNKKYDTKLNAAVRFMKPRMAGNTQIAIILGSGLSAVGDIVTGERINYTKIPNIPVPSVPGHKGCITIGKVSSTPVLIFQGRVHYYEGYDFDTVTFSVRLAAKLGIKCLIITNAAGGINKKYKPSDIVLVRDHINNMGANPLRGKSNSLHWFVDMTNPYDLKLQKVALSTGEKAGLIIKNGVYIAVTGPSYETAAEIKSYRTLGADIVGMSMVPETIVARQLGIKVIGLSFVSNMATGVTFGTKIDHNEVMQMGRIVEQKFIKLFRLLLPKLAGCI
ncbi:MAG: purine-nucleoside phosphorylase [Elusimicrobiota bacterium]